MTGVELALALVAVTQLTGQLKGGREMQSLAQQLSELLEGDGALTAQLEQLHLTTIGVKSQQQRLSAGQGAMLEELAQLLDAQRWDAVQHLLHSAQAQQDDHYRSIQHALRTGFDELKNVFVSQLRLPPDISRPYHVIEHTLSLHFQDPHGMLEALQTQLQAKGTVAVTTALHGMGGVGKTQLALKFSQDARPRYAGVWWFNADNDTTLALDALKLCRDRKLAVPQGQLAITTARDWLVQQTKPWLVVFDNAEDPESIRTHLPNGAAHHVLVTSRNPNWRGIAHPLALDVWTTAQSVVFFTTRLPGAEPSQCALLAEALGGLPLALEQAASYLEVTQAPIAEYLKAIEKVLGKGRASTGYEHSVEATLSVAFAKLSVKAQQLLRLCGFAAPEPLADSLFQAGADALPEGLKTSASDALQWYEIAGELCALGVAQGVRIEALLTDTSKEHESALQFHRLTQQVVRTRLAQPKEDCHAFLTWLNAAMPKDGQDPQRWRQCAVLEPHVTQLEQFNNTQWLDASVHRQLLNRMGIYLQFGAGLYNAARDCFEQALTIARTNFDEEHPDTLNSMNNLASMLKAQGDLDGARAFHEQVLEVRQRTLGEEHPDTLNSMNNLALTLKAQGDLDGARAFQEQVLEARQRTLGEEHPDTLTSMNNLAQTLKAQGDLDGARAFHEQVLEVSQRTLGEEHPDTLRSMNNLASTLYAQGDLDGARAFHEQVLEVRQRTLGEEHPDTLTSMNNLASTLYAQGDLDGARAFDEQVLAVSQRTLGEEHPDTLTSMNNLASTLYAQGDLDGARAFHEQVLEVRQRTLGEEHPATLTSMNNLAGTLYAQGDLDGARALFEKSLEAVRRVLGENHPTTQTMAANLAQVQTAIQTRL